MKPTQLKEVYQLHQNSLTLFASFIQSLQSIKLEKAAIKEPETVRIYSDLKEITEAFHHAISHQLLMEYSLLTNFVDELKKTEGTR